MSDEIGVGALPPSQPLFLNALCPSVGRKKAARQGAGRAGFSSLNIWILSNTAQEIVHGRYSPSPSWRPWNGVAVALFMMAWFSYLRAVLAM